MRSAIAVVMLALLVIGCASSQADQETKMMESWVGVHQSKLLMSWGPPTQRMPDGRGGEILVWGRQATGYTAVPGLAGAPMVIPITHGRSRAFWVDQNGYIYHWQVRGY